MEVSAAMRDLVHERYCSNPNPEVVGPYGVALYTKCEPNEKEIAEVFLPGKVRDIRVGWLIPLISMSSIEHDFSGNPYFIKHVYEAVALLGDMVLDERTYVLVVSHRLMIDAEVNSISELSLSFLSYGVYPFRTKHALVPRSAGVQFTSKLKINRCFDITDTYGYLATLFFDVLPSESNEYARFMLIYQLHELAMDLTFYRIINNYKKEKLPLAAVRDRMSELSSEKKLITLLYQDIGGEQSDAALAAQVRAVLGDAKVESYYVEAHRPTLIYDVRNNLVHNYHRSAIDSNLMYFSNYLELEIPRILSYLFNNEDLQVEVRNNYLAKKEA
jgi:hypothetical protein